MKKVLLGLACFVALFGALNAWYVWTPVMQFGSGQPEYNVYTYPPAYYAPYPYYYYPPQPPSYNSYYSYSYGGYSYSYMSYGSGGGYYGGYPYGGYNCYNKCWCSTGRCCC